MLRDDLINYMLCNNVRSMTSAELEAMTDEELYEEHAAWATERNTQVERAIPAPVNLDARRAKYLLEHGSLPSVYEILKAKRLERGRFRTDKERVATKQKFQPLNW